MTSSCSPPLYMYSSSNFTSIIPDDDCKIVETLIKNVNPFRNVHCFVFYYKPVETGRKQNLFSISKVKVFSHTCSVFRSVTGVLLAIYSVLQSVCSSNPVYYAATNERYMYQGKHFNTSWTFCKN